MSSRFPLVLALLALLSGAMAAHAAPNPSRLWIAWLDGRELATAQADAGKVLDRFPDAVLVSDAPAADALRAAGYRVEGPIAVPKDAVITLLRSRDRRETAARLTAEAFERVGAKLLWAGDRNAIAASEGVLSEDAPWDGHARKAMRTVELPPAPIAAPSTAATQATDFAPGIQGMVDQLDGTVYMDWIRNLAGSRSVTVGGTPVTFTTRATPTTKCDQAEQYVYERLQAMGFTDVQYDPYTFSSVSARNVVATLPGVERPGQVVVLGAHLDSTSPQASTNAPGANDNASGVAGLLAVADILRHHQFRNTIKFIAFTGEEQGLYGSQHYAQAAAARGDSILGAVIFDMIAWKNALYQIDIEGETAWLPIMNVMNDACSRYTGLATQIQLVSWGSDHVPFQDAGYPSFLAIESEYEDYPCYHQTCDSTGWNQAVLGVDVCRASLATVAHLAGLRELTVQHVPFADTVHTAGPFEVRATITRVAGLVPDSLLVHWALGTGAESTVPLVSTGVADQYHGFIPPASDGAHLAYWISVKDSAGAAVRLPSNAPITRYEFNVSVRDTVFSETFESGAPGWTHGGTQDDWQVAAPLGLGEDPAAAWSGTKIAGTDLTGLGANPGRYENGAESWFESPAVNCSLSTGVHLTFQRKLSVERSNARTFDYARVWVNGLKVWESASGTNTLDASWLPQDIDISAIADHQPSVKVKFTLHSNTSNVYGGWNLDDVRLIADARPLPLDAPTVDGVADVRLEPCQPNPSHGSVTLRFSLPTAQRASLRVYDVRGRLVRTVADGVRVAGAHVATWDGRDGRGAPSAPGIYFYRLETPEGARTRRLTLLR